MFNGKLNILSVIPDPVDATLWDIKGTLFDNTGLYSAADVKVGAVIYNDCTTLNMGVMRFKVVLVHPDNLGVTVSVQVKLDSNLPVPNPWSSSDYPIAGNLTIIGGTNQLGVTEVPSMTLDLVDEWFINSIRNIELQRVGEILWGYDKNQNGIVDAAENATGGGGTPTAIDGGTF